jgi:hypothetical protein
MEVVMASRRGSRQHPRVHLTLPDGQVIDATELKVVIDGGYSADPITLKLLAQSYLDESDASDRAQYSRDLDREFEALGGKVDSWNGWGDPPGTH